MSSKDTQLLVNRFVELSQRSYSRSRYEFSEFLSLADQNTLLSMKIDLFSSPYTLDGGFEGSERKIAAFGNEDICGYKIVPPICWISISPVLKKFADDLTHRDFLGSLMGLGIKREMLGDILVQENSAYLVCLDTISRVIISDLKQVKRTTVKCDILDSMPDVINTLPDFSEVVVASTRLDAVVSAVYKVSRSESQEIIYAGRVFISGKLTESTSAVLESGNTVSVRSMGRFIYEGISRETKKNKLRISVRIYK